MDSALDFHTARALLEWQIELGAREAISDVPVDRYALSAQDSKPALVEQRAREGTGQGISGQTHPPEGVVDPLIAAETAAQQADSLESLRGALAAYEHCELKRGARSLVFADGVAQARVMIIGEAPGRDEDRVGRPFVGRAGQLLDRMFECIGLSRSAETPAEALYITNVLPWRPPQNREPTPEEIAMMRPFVTRHVELIQPELIILVGNISCQAGLGKRGITKLRGQWCEAYGKPALPIFHPAYLLRNPQAKREAWADLLEIKARLLGKI